MGHSEKLYTRLSEGVLERVVREQRSDVETISGATTSSKLILLAVEDALKTG
ncbi:MAG: FMN-binding protein [Candidatus Glassbacteria bacterium]|nr:FMN-binding protein [Candidatus Glassbacteria bacterium]